MLHISFWVLWNDLQSRILSSKEKMRLITDELDKLSMITIWGQPLQQQPLLAWIMTHGSYLVWPICYSVAMNIICQTKKWKSQDAWIYSRNILSYQFMLKGKAGIIKYSSTDVALEVFHLENHLLNDPPVWLLALFVDLNVLF